MNYLYFYYVSPLTKTEAKQMTLVTKVYHATDKTLFYKTLLIYLVLSLKNHSLTNYIGNEHE
jgi:hypothetical protein